MTDSLSLVERGVETVPREDQIRGCIYSTVADTPAFSPRRKREKLNPLLVPGEKLTFARRRRWWRTVGEVGNAGIPNGFQLDNSTRLVALGLARSHIPSM
jgi:hypothetical protein